MSRGDVETLERLFNALWREGFARERRLSRVCGGRAGWTAALRLPGGEVSGRVRGFRGMDRLRVEPPYYMRRRGGPAEPLTRAEDAVELLDGEAGALDRLRRELAQSARLMDFFLRATRRRSRGMGVGGRGFLESAAARGSEAALESWILRGHALHPCAKTRFGFRARDLRRYSPELFSCVAVRFVAVRRTHLHAEGDRPLPASWRQALESELGRRGLSPDAYEPVPVHPWQAENALPRLFERELAAGTLVALESSFPARALVSVRTLVPDGEPGAAHLKLPIAVQTTSAMRTVSAPSAQNGPRLSRWLNGLSPRLRGWEESFELLAELGGVHFWDPGAASRDAEALERARHLSAIFRRPAGRAAGTTTVPAALLTEPSPADGRPSACELVEAFGQGPRAFFREYAALSARAVLPPLLAAGTALEAHAQNTLIRFRGGRPERWLARDLGGLRILPEWSPGAPDLHPASVIAARSPEELFAKSHHAWLQGHLCPLASALAEAYGLEEASLWREARGAVRAAFEEAAADLDPARRRLCETLLFAPRVRVKALLRMRLGGRSHEYDFMEVPNPL